jgi:hypothetical protein
MTYYALPQSHSTATNMTRISEFGEALPVMYGPRIKARFMLQIERGTMRNSVLPNVPHLTETHEGYS